MDETATSCRHPRGGAAAPLVNGVRVDPTTVDELAPRIGAFLECGRSHVVHFVPAHPTVLARRDDGYRELLNRADLNLADGLPVAWTLRLLGHRTDRISGTDGFRLLCDWGRSRSIRHYLYGGTAGVLEKLRLHLECAYPGIAVAGAIAPPFRPMTAAELKQDAARIRDSGAHVVWVGLGTPKQDFVAERLRELEAAPVILCVGAAFDFLADAKRRAPEWMQRAGLEWLFRLASEPRRLWRRYLLGNPRFILGVAADAFRDRRHHDRVTDPC